MAEDDKTVNLTIVNSRGEFGMSVLKFLTRPVEINYGRVAGRRMHFKAQNAQGSIRLILSERVDISENISLIVARALENPRLDS